MSTQNHLLYHIALLIHGMGLLPFHLGGFNCFTLQDTRDSIYAWLLYNVVLSQFFIGHCDNLSKMESKINSTLSSSEKETFQILKVDAQQSQLIFPQSWSPNLSQYARRKRIFSENISSLDWDFVLWFYEMP